MIRLTLKAPPSTRLDLDGILPEHLAGLSEAEIARRHIGQGTRSVPLGDWFTPHVTGDAEERLVIAGDCARVDRIGAGMTRGEVIVEANAGAYTGLAMSGGRLRVIGSTAYGAAVAMAGGELRIEGDGGDQLGGAVPGEPAGMREGTVIVTGNAGVGLGDRMRRGLIVVAGSAGACCGARMIAGTIVVGGTLGSHPGVAMRRGSIVAAGGVLRVPPSFTTSGRHELAFLRLLARSIAAQGFGHLASRLGVVQRWTGDLATGGKGEILTPC
jgi:formylmethanofuran dehydrogenase subunit C